MTQSTDLEARVEALETAMSFQDRTIEELSQALADQFRLVDKLRRELQQLGAQLAEVEANPALSPQQEPPPPHY